MLTVKNLTKIYKTNKGVEVHALDNVSIDFSETGMVFLLGRSGSGKSTLLNICGGLDKATSGEVIVKGRSSKDFSQSDFDSYRNTYIGFVFQEYNILNEFSVEQNIALALQLQNKTGDKNQVDKILESVDLAGVGKRKPNTLSGGQRQRVAIARALIKDPKIIMADEPTGALDSNTGKQIFETLKKLSETHLVIVVSHDRGFAEQYGDRIIELADGKIISDVSKNTSSDSANKNVTIINDDTVAVKDWSQVTESDIKEIVDVMKKKGKETIITSNEKSVPEIKKICNIGESTATEKFSTTRSVKLKEYNGKDTQFIKSRLPMRHALKMAGDGVKSKPIRLCFTILLSVIAFIFFGVSTSLAMYNPNHSIAVAMENSHYNSIILEKQYPAYYESIRLNSEGTATEHNTTNVNLRTAFTQAELDRMNDNNVGLKFAGIMDLGVYKNELDSIHGYSSNPLALQDVRLHFDYQRYYSVTWLSGYSDCGHQFLVDNGFSLMGGKYPENHTEIAVPEYIYNIYKNSIAQTYPFEQNQYPTIDSFLGEQIKIQGITFTVVGVYDVGDLPSKYDELLNKDTELDHIGLNLLKEEFADVVYNSWHTVGFVSKDFYDVHKYDNHSASGRAVYGFRLEKSAITSSVSGNDNTGVFTPKTLWKYPDVVEFYDLEMNKTSYDSSDNVAYLPITEFNNYFNGYHFEVKQLTNKEEKHEKFIEVYERWSKNDRRKEDIIFMAKTILSDFETVMNANRHENDPYRETLDIPTTLYFKNLRDQSGSLTVKGFYLFDKGTTGNTWDYFISDSICETYGGPQTENSSSEIYNYKTEYNLDPTVEKYGNIIASTDHLHSQTYFMLDGGENGATYLMRNAVYVSTISMAKLVSEMKIAFYVAGGIFGLFASLMLFNFISVSISSKSKEIGILRAVGARRADVFKIFIAEALIITMTCFIISAVLSYLLCMYMNMFLLTNAVKISILSYGIINVAMLFAIVVFISALATFIPVFKAAGKSPVDSIRAL